MNHQWVAQALSDRSAWAAVDDAAAAVSAAAEGAWPYAMRVGPQTVTALLAGLTPPWPPAPWQSADRGWLIERGILAAADGGGTPHLSDTFVALGSCDGSALLVDLACAPAVIEIAGDHDAARDLMWSLVTQLQIVPRNRVLVAADGPPDRLPDPLSQEASARDEAVLPWTFVACAQPTAADVISLRARAASADRMRVLVLGSVVGSRWSLLAGANGEVTADGLGLVALSRPVLPPPSAARPSVPLTPRSSALPRAQPQHARPRTQPRRSPPAPPGERARPEPDSPDPDDDEIETWISRLKSPDPPDGATDDQIVRGR
jgi:hypothetical protein